jgi:hypothetical protein
MLKYTVAFYFYGTPQNDVQTYSDVLASSKDDAIEWACKRLNEDFPSDAAKKYRVECVLQSQH